MQSRYISTNQIRLHVVEAGPTDGPLVILLHGFPEFWYGWRHQIDALAAAGFRVWAPDQRGYNLSDKPQEIKAYTLDKLGADILGLMDAAGVQRATVVGHDWGGGVAWWLAINHPERLHRVVCLNMPHLSVMPQVMRKNPQQLLRSWYIGFFQLPVLPEWLVRLGNWWGATRALRGTSRPGTFSAADLVQYRQAWAQPGPTGQPAIQTMINWYRALVQQGPQLPDNPRVTVPLLLIWGTRDQALIRELAQPSIELCDRGKLVYIEEATHWVQHEAPDRVNRLIINFAGQKAEDSDELRNARPQNS
ncbi:pimeloyl-ACP methyl ester carboxylesterase [Larkinella arboricola]|uniref:Pimeloyl-ACP methyl ester carboxylesterase n=1 Tax=Larkinella arboricola TaxID=643671 RepID=A0A327X5C5_LARAB|nr:alpha/beta hydrolase [Larkinella arboricola]RAK00554.1 pimeloyl-ACP methyl ester carboxylesterase [Larkinella arboricola]